MLLLLICGILFSPIFSQSSCPSNKTYGLYCNLTCSNCLIGCDVGGSCYNSTCISNYYGNTCNKKLPQPQTPVIKNFTSPPCTITISSSAVIDINHTNIGNFYVFYGFNTTPNKSLSILMTQSTNEYTGIISIPSSGNYNFQTYFTFEDADFYGSFNSADSVITSVTIDSVGCKSLNVTAITSTSSTSSTSTTSTTKSSNQVSTTTSPFQDFLVTIIRSNATLTSIEVQWNPPKTTTGFSNYLVSISPGGTPILLNALVYKFDNLSPNTPYSITISSNFSSGIYNVTGSYRTLNPMEPSITDWIRGYINGNVSWTPPSAPGYSGFQIYLNSMLIGTVSANATQYFVQGLTPATQYLITVAAIYAGSTTYPNASRSVWTKPFQFTSPLNPPIISNGNDNSFQVTFPEYTNYNGTITLYYVAIRLPSSRKKRDATNCQLEPEINVPSSTVVYASSTRPTAPITIGSGSPISPSICANNKLNQNTNYTVYAIVVSIVNNTVEYITSTANIQTTSTQLGAGAIVGIVIAILIFLIALIVLIVFCIRRCKKEKPFQHTSSKVEKKPLSYKYWSSIVDRMQARYIILDKNVNIGITMEDEYENLPPQNCDEHSHHGVTNDAYQRTLSFSENGSVFQYSDRTNYHQNLIDGYFRKHAYIIKLSPLDGEADKNFWKLVYNDNVGQIVMLSEENEVFYSYWPNKSATYDNIEVKLQFEEHFAYFDIRKFSIGKIDTAENIEVIQYHYHSWPSNDRLINITSFLEFHEVIKSQGSVVFGPMLVHCPPGSSLNTVFIGFDTLYDQLSKEKEVNIFRVFGHLRKYKPASLVTVDQYMLIYDFLFESYLNAEISLSFDWKDFFYQRSISPEFQKSCEQQYHYLNDFYHKTSLNQLKRDMHYVFDSIDYRKSIILAPSPTHFVEDCVNIWETIFLSEVEIVVDLIHPVNEMFYISQDNHNYQVLDRREKPCENGVVIQVVSVKNLHTNVQKQVTIFSVTSRDLNRYCETWVEMVHRIIKRLNYKILVFSCGENMTSTHFIACFNAALKFQRTNLVSVYHVVKSLQSSGHPIIENEKQYLFIFEFLKLWIDSRGEETQRNGLPFDIKEMGDSIKLESFKPMYSELSFNPSYKDRSSAYLKNLLDSET